MLNLKKIKAFILVVLLVLSVILSGCSSEAAKAETLPTVSLKTGDVISSLDSSGTVEASLTDDYSLPIKSKIYDIYVREGSMVKSGELLYLVDSAYFTEQLSVFESSFDQALEYSDGVYRMTTVNAPVSGWVRMLKAEQGTDILELSATDSLCVIVTSDAMVIEIASDTLKIRDNVIVDILGNEENGSVIKVNQEPGSTERTVTIEVTKSYYSQGIKVKVYSYDKSSLLGEGKLYYKNKKAVYMTEGFVSNVYVAEGQYVERGDTLFSVCVPSNDTWSVVTPILATADGRIKQLAAVEGENTADVTKKAGKLAAISTAGTMYLEVENENLSINDIVDVKIGSEQIAGTVIDSDTKTAKIEIEDDTFVIGELGYVFKDGESVGQGELTLSEYRLIYSPSGEITELFVSENETVEEGDCLFVIQSPNRKIAANYAEIEDLYAEMAQVNDYELYSGVYAQCDGIVGELNYSEGDSVEAFETVVSVKKTQSYEVSASFDIAYLEDINLGQKAVANFTNGISLQGKVKHIDYNASSEYFSVTIGLDDSDEIASGEVLPGMNAEVSIIKQESLNTQMLPVSALFNDNEGYYVLVDDGTGQGTATYVTVGVMNSQYVEIVSGVGEGDSVILFD